MDAVSGKAKLKPGKAITVDFGEAGYFTFQIPDDLPMRCVTVEFEKRGCQLIHHEAKIKPDRK